MKTCTIALLVILALAGCASTTAPPGTTTFTGEVWNWDKQANTVTLRRSGGETVRVKVTPDQFIGLQLYQNATIRGTLAGPAEIPTVQVPLGNLVPRGPADELEVTGKVAKVDPAGKAAIDSQKGPVEVWVATPTTAVRAGEDVRVKMHVQALQPVPLRAGDPPPAAQAPPTAAVGPQPGDYATVRGTITAVDPAGRLTIESPRGPIQVWVPNAGRYKVNEFVEVRTAVVLQGK
jgi:hypothetical protein